MRCLLPPTRDNSKVTDILIKRDRHTETSLLPSLSSSPSWNCILLVELGTRWLASGCLSGMLFLPSLNMLASDDLILCRKVFA